MKTIRKSTKLDNVCYDIRGPILECAQRMEEEGHKIIKLNIGCRVVEPRGAVASAADAQMVGSAGVADVGAGPLIQNGTQRREICVVIREAGDQQVVPLIPDQRFGLEEFEKAILI